MSDFLTKGLTLAIGKAALAKHLESCEVCSDEHDCVVAKAHKRTLADVSSRPAPTTGREADDE